jgi:hypothetical protein
MLGVAQFPTPRRHKKSARLSPVLATDKAERSAAEHGPPQTYFASSFFFRAFAARSRMNSSASYCASRR